ncbi:FAD-dependent monooxygenase [Micromonospora lupini]|uniref:FAD-dependent monooxygenase n=1 Tax=Micromonospora lupini TaxID=285679 RepID=UPI0033E4EE3E
MLPADADAVIVGAGPCGLFLACELRLAGIRPVVLEKMTDAGGPPKASGINGRIIDVLEFRGLLDRFTAEASVAGRLPIFEFSGMVLDLRKLGTIPLRRMSIPQWKIERLLNGRAEELDVDLRRGHEVLAVDQDEDAVHVHVRGPAGEQRITTRYLVGCDGGRSQVRKWADIDFPGHTDEHILTYLGDALVPDELVIAETGELDLPGVGRVRAGLTRTDRGMFAQVRRDGVHRLAVTEWDADVKGTDGPATLEELGQAIERVLGARIPLSSPRWVTRVLDNTRLADDYRRGRILLVGDAAHVHSSTGGPGLNLGMQDAVNLGWKLAGVLHGWSTPSLLDTYQGERRPVAERVLMHTQAQTGLLAPGPHITQLRKVFLELLEDPATLLAFVNLFGGMDVRYDFPHSADSHPLVGGWFPDFEVVTATGRQAVHDLMHSGAPLLVDLSEDGAAATEAAPWKGRVEIVTARAAEPEPPATALLIRPDGYVAWAAGPEPVGSGLGASLTAWFGAEPR